MAVRVATFNVCHGNRGGGTPVDLPALVDACRSLDADVLALQELDRIGGPRDGRSQARLVAEALGMAWVFAPARRRDRVTSGNGLLVRGSIGAVERIALRGQLRRGPRDQRGAIVAQASARGQAISVAVAHLSLAASDSLPQQRRVLSALERRPGPLLLAGDLNRRTAWVRPGLDQIGFTLADGTEPTAPRDRPRFRIDHLAVRGAKFTQVEVVDLGTSDHRALVAELAIDPTVDPVIDPVIDPASRREREVRH